jgi:GH15 family glucan-1,4-alpha-glucosidase
MAWVAVDRAVRTVEDFGVDGPLEQWRELRGQIHDEVCTQGYNADVGAFTQYYGSDALDASLLMIPLVGFLPASDERVRSTVEVIERGLTEDGFVLRYRTQETGAVDGLTGHEGAFLACSFWMADCLYLIGRYDDAHAMLDRLIGLRNDLGLLAEEYDVRAGRLVGNFPQAFSHVSLVNAAYNLSGHPAMGEQVVPDEHLVRSAGKWSGGTTSMHGLVPGRRARSPYSRRKHSDAAPTPTPDASSADAAVKNPKRRRPR